MNEKLQQFARQSLKEGLALCTEAEQLMFRRMYSHQDLAKPINDIVDAMPADKLSWAMEQVEHTNAHRQSLPGS